MEGLEETWNRGWKGCGAETGGDGEGEEKSDGKETKGEGDECWIGSWKEGFKRGDWERKRKGKLLGREREELNTSGDEERAGKEGLEVLLEVWRDE